MSLTKEESRLKPEEVVHEIQQLIASGEVRPGDKLLPQRDLAKRLNVSRGSLREAVKLMVGMGLLDVTPRGTYVRQARFEDLMKPLLLVMSQDAQDVYMLLEARKIVESEAARLAAIRADGKDLHRLQGLIVRLRGELDAGEFTGESDSLFHSQIVNASKNTVLVSLMSVIVALMESEYEGVRQKMMSDTSEAFYAQHVKIYESIKAQDPNAAANHVREHLNFTMEEFLHHLSR